jgi:hypothetical protein
MTVCTVVRGPVWLCARHGVARADFSLDILR